MEKDKWKSFIEENRSEFDNESADPQLWSRIEFSLDQQAPKMVKLSTVLRIAAAILIVASAGIFLLLNSTRQTPVHVAGHSRQTTESEYILSSISPEYREVETYYVSRINSAMNELESFTPDEELLSAIADLDAEFKQLKSEMKENVNQGEIIEAMIMNYRLKLELLEKMLDSFNEEEQHSEVENNNDYKTI